MAKAKKAAKKAAPKKAALKDTNPPPPKKNILKPIVGGRAINGKEKAAQTVTLDVKFKDVATGLSKLTATCMGVSKTITESDTITFENVPSGETIDLDGRSNGKTNIDIDVPAIPPEMDFDEGQKIITFFTIK